MIKYTIFFNYGSNIYWYCRTFVKNLLAKQFLPISLISCPVSLSSNCLLLLLQNIDMDFELETLDLQFSCQRIRYLFGIISVVVHTATSSNMIESSGALLILPFGLLKRFRSIINVTFIGAGRQV